jgi:hypothetical protein
VKAERPHCSGDAHPSRPSPARPAQCLCARAGSGSTAVLIDQPTKHVQPFDRRLDIQRADRAVIRHRHRHVQAKTTIADGPC